LAIKVDLQARDGVNQNDRLNFLFARPMNIWESLKDTLIGHSQLHLRDSIAKAAVNAMAKGNMLFNILTRQVEDIRG
jgi:hypothetical protein